MQSVVATKAVLEKKAVLRAGALAVFSFGNIDTGPRFHDAQSIYPVGYEGARLFWSVYQAYERVPYIFSITSQDRRPLFKIQLVGQAQFWTGATADGAGILGVVMVGS